MPAADNLTLPFQNGFSIQIPLLPIVPLLANENVTFVKEYLRVAMDVEGERSRSRVVVRRLKEQVDLTLA